MATTTATTTEMELDTFPSSSLTDHDPKGRLPESQILEAVEEVPAAPAPDGPEEPAYSTGSRFYLICLAIILVLILGGVDNSIVSTAVPAITDHFHTVADVGWYSAAYRLSICSLQFTIGKLYKIFPVKSIFLTCIVIFLVGSVFCAAATSSAMFIAGRAITGAGSAGFLSGCFVLLASILPLEKRPTWQSIFYGTELVFTNLAPTIGGALTEKLGWRWCFWINLPMGAIVLLVIAFVLPNSIGPPTNTSTTRKEKLHQLDLVGNLVLIPSLACLFIALSWAGTKYAWNSPTVVCLFVTFAVLLGIFAWDQYTKQDAATLPPRVMKNRSVMAAMLYVFCSIAASSVLSYYMPVYFQSVRGYSPTASGLLLLPKTASFTVALLLTGRATSYIGYYAPFMLIASVLFPLGAGLITTWTPDTNLARLIIYPILSGIAGGLGSQGPSTAVQAVLPQSDVSLGISIVFFASNFGPAVAIPVAQTIFAAKLQNSLMSVAPDVDVKALESMGLTALTSSLGSDKMGEVAAALNASLRETQYLSVGLACALIVGAAMVEWKSVKQKRS